MPEPNDAPSLSGRLRHAWKRTQLTPGLRWVVLPAVAAAAATVGGAAYLGADDKAVVLTIVGLVGLICYWGIIKITEFGWNFWRAGDRLAIDTLNAALADRDATIAEQQIRIGKLELAEQERDAQASDDEIINGFTEQTKKILVGWEKDLTKGHSANHYSTEVIAQLREHDLVDMSEVAYSPFGQGDVINSQIRLNPKGLRVLKRLKESSP